MRFESAEVVCLVFSSFVTKYCFCYGVLLGGWRGSTTNTTALRHNGYGCVALMDGHVEAAGFRDVYVNFYLVK